jgi:hypothetical protein
MATSNGEGRAAHRQKPAERPEPENQPSNFHSDASSVLTAAALIGGVALLQPELIAGMAIGAGAALLSGWASTMLRPVFKAGVKAAYSAADAVNQAAEGVQDLVSEARAEHDRSA